MDWKLGRVIAVSAAMALSACSTTQIVRTGTGSGNVEILYTAPQRAYITLGIVSAKKYKPGFSDPTVADAMPQLQNAARQLGADAIIVGNSQQGNGNRFVTVEAQAIKYNDKGN